MKILFIGLGSAGMRHANLIYKHFPQYGLYALRSGKSDNQLPFVADLNDWNQVKAIHPDIAFICSPTYRHVGDAYECADLGMDLFIEKPLDAVLDGIPALLSIVERKKLTAYIAYPFRFHEGILHIKGQDYQGEVEITCCTDVAQWGKQSYSFDRKKGGGVLLELSHEIDLAEFLFGKIVNIETIYLGHIGNRDIEDIAILKAIHLNGRQTCLGLLFGYNTGIHCRSIRIGDNSFYYQATEEMYLDQLKYFFNNIDNPYLINNIFEAAGLFQKIMEVQNGKTMSKVPNDCELGV